ncbi:hypothetical protein I4U23_022636 [Adineta vaga]|nr:hypothetical protein I4U23_022636 [Adineta vaga]
MSRTSVKKSESNKKHPVDRRGAIRRIENEIVEEGREIEYGLRGRRAPIGRYNGGYGYQQPPINVFVQWTPEFGMAYQQFVNGGMGGYPRGGMGGYPMGGMGGYPMGGMGGYPMGGMGGYPMGGGGVGGYGGGIQGVPIGFGVTTS